MLYVWACHVGVQVSMSFVDTMFFTDMRLMRPRRTLVAEML
jgi:hypothetical protein